MVSGTSGGSFGEFFDGGSIKVYSGTILTHADDSITDQVSLVTNAYSATAYGDASGGSISANAITGAAGDNSGVPSFALLLNSSGIPGALVTVGKVGGTEELLIDTTNEDNDPYVTAGGTTTVTSLTHTIPEGS
jgi:hypothetical protein